VGSPRWKTMPQPWRSSTYAICLFEKLVDLLDEMQLLIEGQ
jgi:hypothetical protein